MDEMLGPNLSSVGFHLKPQDLNCSGGLGLGALEVRGVWVGVDAQRHGRDISAL